MEFWSRYKTFIHENASKKIVCQMAAILSRGDELTHGTLRDPVRLYEPQIWSFTENRESRCPLCVSSLWHGDAMWRHNNWVNTDSGNGLLPDDIKALPDYLDQGWLIINAVWWHSSESNSTRYAEDAAWKHDILGLRPANERRCYFVTTSLIGWSQTYNRPCYGID